MMNIRFKLTTSKQIILPALLCLWMSALHITNAQNIKTEDPIVNLHKGTLIVRFPAYQSKIDTLQAMIDRSKDTHNRQRLEKLLLETKENRDTLLQQYTRAFQKEYTFSKAAYYFDSASRNLNTASYYNMSGEQISVGELSEMPIYYLYFERTEESKIDAMVLYDRMNKKVPSPAPNNFTQGGLNLIIVKISEKKFPDWRVKKMNKRFWKYYNDMRMAEVIN